MEYHCDTREDLAPMLAAAMDVAPQAILITDSNVVLYANGEAHKLLKCSDRGALLGRAVSDLVHPDVLQTSRMRGEILKVSTATLHGLPVKLMADDGSSVCLTVSGTPVDFDGGRVFMFTSEG